MAQDRVRFIGVCFGHQILGRALGVKTGRSGSWEVSVCDVDLSAKGQELFGKKRMVMFFFVDRTTLTLAQAIHQMHKDIVFAFPQNVERLGSSPRCENQGMYVPRKLISVQGHPEFSETIMRELLQTRVAQGIFTPEIFDDGIARVANEHDGVLISAAFIKFLLDGR